MREDDEYEDDDVEEAGDEDVVLEEDDSDSSHFTTSDKPERDELFISQKFKIKPNQTLLNTHSPTTVYNFIIQFFIVLRFIIN